MNNRESGSDRNSVRRRTRIKFCGMMSAADIALAVDVGADAVGVILAPSSPRKVDIDALPALAAAIPPFVTKVGVLTAPSESEAACLRALGFILQFSGEETAAECERLAENWPYIKAFHLRVDVMHAAGMTYADAFAALDDYPNALAMFDSRVADKLGGTGVPFRWDMTAPFARHRRIIVSGGLTAENVGACVRALRPYAVDVRSGIETDGRKDAGKMRAFVCAVRQADQEDPGVGTAGVGLA